MKEDTGHSVTLPPPPGRRVPRRNNNTREGGVGALDVGGGHGHREGIQGGSGDSVGHGGSGGSGDHGLFLLGGHGGSGISVALALGPATHAEDI